MHASPRLPREKHQKASRHWGIVIILCITNGIPALPLISYRKQTAHSLLHAKAMLELVIEQNGQ